jgi:hypothetical protein
LENELEREKIRKNQELIDKEKAIARKKNEELEKIIKEKEE